MQWKLPPRIKVYEALGAIADGRVKVKGNTATVTSSSGNKHYIVQYDPKAQAIVANDNGSYWQGYVGYPAIAFLMVKHIVPYDESAAQWLKGIPWKDINVRLENDYDEVEKEIKKLIQERGGDLQQLGLIVKESLEALESHHFEKLLSDLKPPLGY